MGKNLLIFIGGVDNEDYEGLHEMAKDGSTSRWSSTKTAKVGDRVLIYIAKPHSALIAKAEVISPAKKGKEGDWQYVAKIGNVELLPNQLTIKQLKTIFPKWGHLKMFRSKCHVPAEYAKQLWDMVHEKPADGAPDLEKGSGGAGFGDYKTNKLVEEAAIKKATNFLKQNGYTVVSREKDKIGYDLEARKGSKEIHVEVKGSSGKGKQFLITRQETEMAKNDPLFQIWIITDALSLKPEIIKFTGAKFLEKFELNPISYMAVKQ